MKKLMLMTFIVVTFFAMSAVSASAAVNGVVKVGLRYGDTALFSANLENQIGAGYFFGYYDDARAFNAVGWTGQTAISMTASGDIHVDQNGTYSREAPAETFYYMGPWHVQLNGYASFEEAATAAAEYGGYPAWIDWEYVVRIGCYGSQEEAVAVAAEYGVDTVVQSTSTGVLVTATRSTEVLFEFDCSGVLTLGVQPDGLGETAVTWFKGYKYPGGFEYPRQTGGDLNVMMNSILAAQASHTFLYRGWEVTSEGNDYAHAILRGYTDFTGRSVSNYHYEDLLRVGELCEKANLKNPSVIVDTNHNNSGKQYMEQIRIAKDVVHSRNQNADIKRLVKGLMIESYIEDGAQGAGEHVFGKSITDPCLGWEKTERLILDIAEKL